ncbi:PAS domain S-box protein, partial [bacterium]|nr:PAS domain S-box protein [bacterium]
IKKNQRLLRLIFCNVSPIHSLSIKLAKKLNIVRFDTHVVENYADAIKIAKAALKPRKSQSDSSVSEIVSNDDWQLRVDNYSVKFEIIDGLILHADSTGEMEEWHVKPIFELHDRIMTSNPSLKGSFYFVSGVVGLKVSRKARNKYVKQMIQWQKKYPFKLYIFYGANSILTAAINILKGFAPFQVRTVKDYDGMLKYIAEKEAKGWDSPSKKETMGQDHASSFETSRYVDELLHYLGSLNWEIEGSNGLMEIDPSHPFKPVFDAIELIKMDTADIFRERNESEQRLKANEKRFRQIVNILPVTVFQTDVDGQFQFVNKTGFSTLGYTMEDVRNGAFNALDMVSPSDYEKAKNYIRNVLEGKGEEMGWMEYMAIRKDKTEFPVSIKTILIENSKGEKIGMRGVIQDITYRKTAEENLRKAHNELERKVEERTADYKKAREEAEQANRLKTEFLANISHELRTPMHHILSYSTYGVSKIDTVKKEKLLHYFTQIKTSGERLMMLLNDLLDLSKLESGHVDYQMKKTNLELMVEAVISEFSHVANEKSIRLKMIKPDIETIVVCDEAKIGQVLRNLFSNSIKFTPEDKSITVLFSSMDLAGGKRRTDKNTIPGLMVSVKDEGVGIPESELIIVFNKFIQSSKTKTGAGGTGLGLAICKEIIEDHRGQIWAENNPEGGATFNFLLPLEQ